MQNTTTRGVYKGQESTHRRMNNMLNWNGQIREKKNHNKAQIHTNTSVDNTRERDSNLLNGPYPSTNKLKRASIYRQRSK